jgi:hypothetical protein
MKKTIGFAIALVFAWVGLAQAGPHPHGPFPKHKSSVNISHVHHNPHKPGPASFHTASVHPGNK